MKGDILEILFLKMGNIKLQERGHFDIPMETLFKENLMMESFQDTVFLDQREEIMKVNSNMVNSMEEDNSFIPMVKYWRFFGLTTNLMAKEIFFSIGQI